MQVTILTLRQLHLQPCTGCSLVSRCESSLVSRYHRASSVNDFVSAVLFKVKNNASDGATGHDWIMYDNRDVVDLRSRFACTTCVRSISGDLRTWPSNYFPREDCATDNFAEINLRDRLRMQLPNEDIQRERRTRNVRRRLFQDDEEDNEGEPCRNSGVEDNLANSFFEEARKNRENAKERWNFDFEKEEPLPGRYAWVKLDQDGNEIYNPGETSNRVENLQSMQEEGDVQDDEVTMQEQPDDKDDEKMTDSTSTE